MLISPILKQCTIVWLNFFKFVSRATFYAQIATESQPQNPEFLIIPPANFVCRGYTDIDVVRPYVRPSITSMVQN